MPGADLFQVAADLLDRLRDRLHQQLHRHLAPHDEEPLLRQVLDVQLEAHRHLCLLGHELLLSVDEPAQLGDVRRESPDPLHEAIAVLGEHRLVAVQHPPHVLQRQLELAQPPDRVRPPGLLERVEPVAGRLVDPRRLQQADFRVVAQRLHAQLGQTCEAADR